MGSLIQRMSWKLIILLSVEKFVIKLEMAVTAAEMQWTLNYVQINSAVYTFLI